MVIDKNWSIVSEDANNCILTFQEERERTKKDGTTENYIFKDEWFYPSVAGCLRKYLEIVQKDAEDVKACIELTEATFKKLEKLKHIT